MSAGNGDPRIALIARLVRAYAEESDRLGPHAALGWPNLPDVAAMTVHLGSVHRWVTAIVRSRERAPRATDAPLEADLPAWFDEGGRVLLDALAAVPAHAPCWVLGDRTATAGFWRRRMVFEHAKHLMDVRASGADRWTAAPELTAEDYADGVDELLAEFLPRSRRTLVPLSGPVQLTATDLDRSWLIGPEWTVGEDSSQARARIRAAAGDLALLLWQRADPLQDPRFDVDGDAAAVAALRDAPIHPW